MEIREEDITVKLIDMEIGIHDQLTQASDGHYTIFLNARDAVDQRVQAYEHALNHLRNDDFEKADVQKIETDAHHIVDPQEPVAEPPKKKRRRRKYSGKSARRKFLDSIGYDYLAAAENRWLDPDR